jgi:hypothetical protein
MVDPADTFSDLPVDDPADTTVLADTPADPQPEAQPAAPSGGLAAAIARQREVKQELEKTRRQQAQSQGVRRI